MTTRWGFRPAAGAFLCLGAGAGVFVLSDPRSEARRRIASRASEVRRRVLLRALTKRFVSHTDANNPRCVPPSKVESEGGNISVDVLKPPSSTSMESPELMGTSQRVLVVSGSEDALTALATERIHETIVSPGRNRIEEGYMRPARLIIPPECCVGNGFLSSLIEESLLSIQRVENPDEIAPSVGTLVEADAVSSMPIDGQQHVSGPELVEGGNGSDDNSPEEKSPKPSDSLTAVEDDKRAEKNMRPKSFCSAWELLMLSATRFILDAEQLDRDSLWALEEALRASVPSEHRNILDASRDDDQNSGNPHQRTIPSSPGRGSYEARNSEDDNEAIPYSESRGPSHEASNAYGSSVQPRDAMAIPGANPRSFFVQIVGSREVQHQERGMGQTAMENEASPRFCGEILRWGWDLARQGLATVSVSSSNPWVLLELKRALLQENQAGHPARRSPWTVGATDGESSSPPVQAEDEDEVVVARVAQRSPSEQEQEVMSVAEDLGVDGRLVPSDVTLLANFTGGRRVDLFNILSRLRHRSPPSPTVADACHAAVDDYARELASSWGLLPPDTCHDHEPHRSKHPDRFLDGRDHPAADDVAERGEVAKQEWAPLWETLGVLCAPTLAVGAGASHVSVPPQDSIPPAQLSEACGMDAETMMRLIQEGWLEASPAEPSSSGIALHGRDHASGGRRHPRPPVTVHLASVPLASLARLDRTFVGASPLLLAAFRRIADAANTLPPSGSKGIGDDLPAGGLARNGWGGTGASWRAASETELGEHENGSRQHDELLERAGHLIEASVLRRLCSREEGRLAEDRKMLGADWVQLEEVRRLLESEGPGDMSGGEWAEVQLELIRQERVVVARAHEMQARQSRTRSLSLQASRRENRAFRLGTSPSAPRKFTEDPETATANVTGGKDNEEETGYEDDPEDAVIRDAEGGVRLMPLRSGRGEPSAADGDSTGFSGKRYRQGIGVGALWTWLKRLL